MSLDDVKEREHKLVMELFRMKETKKLANQGYNEEIKRIEEELEGAADRIEEIKLQLELPLEDKG